MSRLELALRVLVAVAAAAATLLGAPTVMAAPIGIASLAATAELVARIPSRPARERAMIGAGFVLVALVLLALVLNVLPWGLTDASWNVAWAAGSLAVIALRRRTRAGWWTGRPPLRGVGWLLPSAAIVLMAVAVALRGTAIEDAPPLALGVVSRTAVAAVVSVEAGAQPGSYLLVRETAGSSPVVGTAFTLRSSERVERTMPLAPGASTVILLLDARSRAILRRVTVG